MAEVALIRRWLRQWLMRWLGAAHAEDLMTLRTELYEQIDGLREQLKPKPQLTAGDIAKRHEQKASGRKPWRVMQREAELESSPEIQREKRIEKENKEIANA